MKAYRHIIDRMVSLRDEEQAANLSRFFKTGPGQYGEGDVFLGIKVPQTRLMVKEFWKECNLDDVKQLLESEYHEVRLIALLILVQIYRHAKKDVEFQRSVVKFYLNNTAHMNNWDLVDLSCYEIVGAWCLQQPQDRPLLTELARNGRTLWDQRIGIVSTMALVRAGQLDECLECADILLHHSHDLIHKATGWLLREVGKKDGTVLREFLRTRYQTMPRTMLRYAIEKFPEQERQSYLKGKI